jgi:hypothetical protein
VAFLTVLFRQRFAVLGVLVLLAAAGVFLGLRGQVVPVGALFLSALSLVAAFGVTFVHLRHVAFTAVAVIAPLPGMIAAGPFAIAHGVGLLVLLAAYGWAVVAGALWAAAVLRGIAGNRDRAEAALVQPVPLLVAMALAGVVLAVVLAGWLFRSGLPLAIGTSVVVAAGTISAVLFVAVGALVLPFSETAVTEINRAVERRALRLRLLTQVVEGRWGLSFAGVVLVLAVLGYFGIAPMLSKGSFVARPENWGAAGLIAFAAAFVVGRDWREAMAVVLALATETLLALWLWAIAVGHLTMLALVLVMAVDGVALMLMLVFLARARSYRMSGDLHGVARLKALEDCAVPAVYGCAGAGAAILPWIVVHGSMATLAMLFVFAGGAASIGLPAVAAALEALIRRRFSVEQLYGRR